MMHNTIGCMLGYGLSNIATLFVQKIERVK